MTFTIVLTSLLMVVPSAMGQFRAICNTKETLESKTCCPNNCGGPSKGSCQNVTLLASSQSDFANSTITEILRNAPITPQKGTIDARYLWPTLVFENVCICEGHFWGVDCNECDFGWTGANCNERKTPVLRKSFSRLSDTEKETFINATRKLKQEQGIWSVIVEEPANYSSGTVKLQNVSTYDMFIFLHNYVTRDSLCSQVDKDISTIDFAHSGPVFPVWHRRYILTVEREFQRITNDPSFGFPYWQWEQNDTSIFSEEYYGVPANVFGPARNVSGQLINPTDWNTICDVKYWNQHASCEDSWKPCNPAGDLAARRPLQRGGGSTYLPNVIEVMIAIAAPSYDAADKDGQYTRDCPRASFRSRLEGWNIICSAVNCTGPRDTTNDHMHNNVHDWMGGQMDVPAAAVNDPVFNLHHCNVDRILESWMQRFASGQISQNLLPAYVPVSGGHPGHNRGDYMVPFFPLVTAGDQYQVAEEWGYTYDELIPADIDDSNIPNCAAINVTNNNCPVCDANTTCIKCNKTCPAPNTITEITQPISPEGSSTALELGLSIGLTLGILFLIAVFVLIIVIVSWIYFKKIKSQSYPDGAVALNEDPIELESNQ